jgi:tetratricopeptide (TPR) repeat protein
VADLYEEALSLYPQEMTLFAKLREIYQKLGLTEKLLHTWSRASEQQHGKERVASYLEIASLLQGKLQREREAITYYQKILEIEPHNLGVLETLKAYYAKQQAYPQFIDIMLKIIAVAPATALAGHLEIARLQRDKVKDVNAAMRSYREVLKLSPDYLDAWRALRDLHASQEQWDSYFEMSQKLLALIPGVAERLGIHAALVEVYRKKGDTNKVATHLREILQLKPDDLGAIQQLSDIYRQKKQWPQLVEILEKETRVVNGDNTWLSQKYSEIAHFYHKELDNSQEAIRYYEKATQLLPGNAELCTQLEDLYRETSLWDKLSGVLESEARFACAGQAVVAYLCQAAAIYADKLRQPDRALALYQEALAQQPENKEVVAAVEKLYHAMQKPERLAEFYYRHSKLIADVNLSIAMHLRAAQFGRQELKNIAYTIAHYEAVNELQSDHKEALNMLIELYRLEQQWQKLVAAYEKKLGITSDMEEKKSVLYELAALYHNNFQWDERAIDCYHEILRMDAKNIKAILALEEVCRDQERWEELALTLEKKVAVTHKPDKQKEVFYELGDIHAHRTYQIPKAIVFFEEALKRDDKDRRVWQALHELYRQTGNLQELTRVIPRNLVFISEPETRIPVELELAAVHQRLNNPVQAAQSLESVLEQDARHEEAFRRLEDIYRQTQQYANLLSLWERRLYIIDFAAQKQLTLQMAHVLERELKDDEQAQKILRQVIDGDPAYQPARDALAALYRKLEKWEPLIELYEGELQNDIGLERKAWLYRSIGDIWQNLGNLEQALAKYEGFMALVSDDLAVIKHVEDIYSDKQKWPYLVSAYERELEIARIDRERRIALLLRSADIYENELQNEDKARENYLAVLHGDLDDKNLQAIRGLQRIYEKIADYKALAETLSYELTLANSERANELKTSLGTLYETKLQDLKAAAPHFREVYRARPQDVAILRRLKSILASLTEWPEYAELLEQEILLLANSHDALVLHRELMRLYPEKLDNVKNGVQHGEIILQQAENDLDAILYLQELYPKTGNQEALAQMYLKEGELKFASCARERLIFLYLEAGKIYQGLAQDAYAIACLQKVVELQPSHSEALSRLVGLLSQGQKWQELIHIYELTAGLSRNLHEKEDLHVKIAMLWEKEFSNPDKAFTHYQIACQLNGKNLEAVHGMRLILEGQQKWGEAVEAMEVEAALLDEKKRPALYLRSGEVWEEKLKVPHEAIRSYLRVMEYGFHRATAEKILRLQEMVGDAAGIAAILEKDARVTDLKSEELIPKLLKLGDIYARKLDNGDDAIRVYSAVLKLESQHEEALQAMETLLEKKLEWAGLASVLKRRIANAKEPELLFRLHSKLATVYRDGLHQGQYAIVCHEKAFEIEPGHLATIHSLEVLYEEWGYFHQAVALYNRELSLTQDKLRQLWLYRRMGEIWRHKLFDPYQAIANYEKLWAMSGDHETAQTLAALYQQCKLWEKLPAVLAKLGDTAKQNNDVKNEIRLHYEMGKVQQELGDIGAASHHFEQVLELDLLHGEAFASLEIVYKKQDRYNDLVTLLGEKARLLTQPEQVAAIQLQMGNIYEEKLGQAAKAIVSFEAVRALLPAQTQALAALHRLYLKTENWEMLIAIAKAELKLAQSESDKAELCYLLGITYLDHLADPALARQHFENGLVALPSHIPCLRKLAEIETAEEKWEAAIGYLQKAEGYVEKPQDKVPLLLAAANLYRSHMADKAKAQEMYRQVLRLLPDTVEALTPLSKLCFAESNWSEAEPLLARLVALLPKLEPGQAKGTEVTRRAELYYHWGKVAEAMGRQEEAISRYLQSLEFLPEHSITLLALGQLYFTRGNLQESLAVYQRASKVVSANEQYTVYEKMGNIEERLNHFALAIAHYEKLQKILPDAGKDVLLALSRLYAKNNELEKSLPYLDELIEGDFGSQERYLALKQKANILAELKQHQKAVAVCLEIAEYNPKDPEIAALLVSLYSDIADWEQAKVWNQRHVQMLPDNVSRVKNRLLQGYILWQGMQNASEAVSAYEEAMYLDPTSIQAIKGIANIYLQQRIWDKLARAYQKFLEQLPAEKRNLGFPIHVALGHLLHEQMGDPQGAIAQFEKALELESDHLDIHIALTELKAQDPSYAEDAIQGHRALLRRDPFRTASYRALYDLCKKEEHSDFSLRVTRAQAFLDSKNLPPNLAGTCKEAHKPASVQGEAVTQYLIPSRVNIVRELMALTGDCQENVYPTDLTQKYGVRKKDHLGVEAVQRPVWYYTYNTMQVLGLKDVNMYINPQKSDKVIIENTTPPSIVISQALIEKFAPEELPLLVTKYLFYIAQKQTLAYKLQPEELQIYLYLLRTGFVSAKEELSPEAKTMQKKILGNVPRNIRKSLETRTDVWEAMQNVNIGQYLKCLDYASNRLILLLSDSLELTIRMVYYLSLLEQGKPLTRVQNLEPEAVRDIDGVSDLLMFNMSEQYGKIRKLCGIAQ